MELKTYVNVIGEYTDKISAGVKKTQDAAERAFNGIQKAAVAAGIATTVISAGFVQAIQPAMNFEQGMKNVQAVANLTSEELKRVSGEAMAMGGELGIGANQAAEGLANFASAGYNATQMTQALKPALELAKAESVGLAQSTELLSSTITSFGLLTSDSVKVANTLTAATGASTATMEKLGVSLKYIGPVARSFNTDLKTSTAALGVLYNSGISAEMAGTALRNMYSTLSIQSQALADKLKPLGLTFQDVDIKTLGLVGVLNNFKKSGIDASGALSLFGEVGSGIIPLLQAGGVGLEDMKSAMDRQLTTSEKAAMMNATLAGSYNKLKAEIENAFINLGSGGASSGLQVLIGYVTDLVKWFNALPVAVRDGIGTMAALSAGVSIAGGSFIVFVGAISQFAQAIQSSWSFIAGMITRTTALTVATTASVAADTAKVASLQAATGALTAYNNKSSATSAVTWSTTISIRGLAAAFDLSAISVRGLGAAFVAALGPITMAATAIYFAYEYIGKNKDIQYAILEIGIYTDKLRTLIGLSRSKISLDMETASFDAKSLDVVNNLALVKTKFSELQREAKNGVNEVDLTKMFGDTAQARQIINDINSMSITTAEAAQYAYKHGESLNVENEAVMLAGAAFQKYITIMEAANKAKQSFSMIDGYGFGPGQDYLDAQIEQQYRWKDVSTEIYVAYWQNRLDILAKNGQKETLEYLNIQEKIKAAQPKATSPGVDNSADLKQKQAAYQQYLDQLNETQFRNHEQSQAAYVAYLNKQLESLRASGQEQTTEYLNIQGKIREIENSAIAEKQAYLDQVNQMEFEAGNRSLQDYLAHLQAKIDAMKASGQVETTEYLAIQKQMQEASKSAQAEADAIELAKIEAQRSLNQISEADYIAFLQRRVDALRASNTKETEEIITQQAKIDEMRMASRNSEAESYNAWLMQQAEWQGLDNAQYLAMLQNRLNELKSSGMLQVGAWTQIESKITQIKSDEINKRKEILRQEEEIYRQFFDTLGQSIGEGIGRGKKGMESALKGILKGYISFAQAFLATQKAVAVAKSIFGDVSGIIILGVAMGLLQQAKSAVDRLKFAKGGQVNGPEGRDVIPAMLTNKEIVINREVAEKYQAPLLRINSGISPEQAFGWKDQFFKRMAVLEDLKLAKGGQANGPDGRDVIPAMLTRNEIVIRRDVAERYQGPLLKLNAGASPDQAFNFNDLIFQRLATFGQAINYLDAKNDGGIVGERFHFADGGLVSPNISAIVNMPIRNETSSKPRFELQGKSGSTNLNVSLSVSINALDAQSVVDLFSDDDTARSIFRLDSVIEELESAVISGRLKIAV